MKNLLPKIVIPGTTLPARYITFNVREIRAKSTDFQPYIENGRHRSGCLPALIQKMKKMQALCLHFFQKLFLCRRL
jgi:hypothetical protein